MSVDQMPPWLQEHVARMQQTQNNLQAVMAQLEHLAMEEAETKKALEELQKASDSDGIFKHSGILMIKSTKKEMTDELEERQEMAKTRKTVLEKQQDRLKETLKEQETKITEMMKGGAQAKDENPRK